MESWQKYAIATLLMLVVGMVAFSAGLTVAGEGPLRFLTTDDGDADIIVDAYDRIRNQAVDPPSDEVLTRGAIRGMVKALRKAEDPYANFYDPEGLSEIEQLTEGNFSGIGVGLQQMKAGLLVLNIIPDSPAKGAGLRPGDVIRSVDGKTVKALGSEAAINRIKGEAGTKVTIALERKGKTLTFKLTRATIDLPNVRGRVTRDGYAHLELYSFGRGAAEQLRAELKKALAKDARGVILDLRGNPGGLFSEAVGVASLFIENGPIVIYKDKEDGTRTDVAEGEAYENVPLVVLVNGGSASASEIVAGALQDRNRAELVGTTTFGKAAVQEVQPLPDGSAVKLTVATYLTPKGDNITGKGITPDVVIEDLDPEPPDTQFRRAAQLLEEEIAADLGDS